MDARKICCLLLTGALSGALFQMSTLVAAESLAEPDSTATAIAPDMRTMDLVVEPLGSSGSGANWPDGEPGQAAALRTVQNGGWQDPNSNSNWSGSNNNWNNNGRSWPVTCQSTNHRRNTCSKPSNQTVRLERQLSNTRCTQGSNWGQNRNQIWVDNGCSGRFVPTGNNWGGGGSGGNRPEVVCESRNFRYTQCNWRNNWGFPQLVQQISQTRCVRDRNWGYNRNRAFIWVSDGCAARFRGR